MYNCPPQIASADRCRCTAMVFASSPDSLSLCPATDWWSLSTKLTILDMALGHGPC